MMVLNPSDSVGNEPIDLAVVARIFAYRAPIGSAVVVRIAADRSSRFFALTMATRTFLHQWQVYDPVSEPVGARSEAK
jgi:hypothetical protein